MVATWKKTKVEDLKRKILKSKVVGLVNISGIPSRQFQQMRKGLKGKAKLKIAKNNLMKRAFEKAKIDKLGEYVQGSSGIIFTDMDPFRLNKLMGSIKTTAPAKPGSAANKDIVIPAGDTPFKPGPIIGELQKVGINAKIEGGKIVITEDSPVVKKDEIISTDLANVLSRLGIEPIELGLEIRAAYENGIIYPGDLLKIDEDRTIANLQNAHKESLNLALNSGIYNSTTIDIFLRNAFSNSISLAINAEIINKESIGFMLSKANMQMLSVASRIPKGSDSEIKKEKKEEKLAEEEKPTEEKRVEKEKKEETVNE